LRLKIATVQRKNTYFFLFKLTFLLEAKRACVIPEKRPIEKLRHHFPAFAGYQTEMVK
jgi:hypothetical protein